MVKARQDEFLALERRHGLAEINSAAFEAFMQKPYMLRQIRSDRYELIIPRFINFVAGWPVRTDGEYMIYEVSRFIDLITPLPNWLRDELGYQRPEFSAHLEDDILVIDQGDPDAVWTKLGRSKRFSHRDGSRLRMISRNRFDILRTWCDRESCHMHRWQFLSISKDREVNRFIYVPNRRDFETFEQYGAISIFATGGAGKTFFGLHALDRLKHRKVIFAPRRAILDQWQARIQSHLPRHVLNEVELRTYQSLKRKPLTGEYSLVIYDEIQHMPADMGLRASQINAATRIGLSATPWQMMDEDIIPALCGIPAGMDWPAGESADTTIWLVKNEHDKFALVDGLLLRPTRAKTMIFVYRLDVGERLAKRLGVPFIYGGTSNQYDAIQAADTFVISKVGDAGISIDVSRVIEVDWLGGRAEAGQRALRTQHAAKKGELHILMTRQEYQENDKRLSALYALGFDVKVRQ
jgi:DNA excision repair protein ERCC-3